MRCRLRPSLCAGLSGVLVFEKSFVFAMGKCKQREEKKVKRWCKSKREIQGGNGRASGDIGRSWKVRTTTITNAIRLCPPCTSYCHRWAGQYSH